MVKGKLAELIQLGHAIKPLAKDNCQIVTKCTKCSLQLILIVIIKVTRYKETLNTQNQ